MPEKRQVTLRMSVSQHAKITAAARRVGMTTTAFVVASALNAGNESDSIDQVRELLHRQNEAFASDITTLADQLEKQGESHREQWIQDFKKLMTWMRESATTGTRQ